jgi:hypothetical protein
MKVNRRLRILWPAFLAACALELLVFGFVDPMEVQWFDNMGGWTRQGVYTIAFFAFWGVSAMACFLTTYLSSTSDEAGAPDSGGRLVS